MLQSCTFNPPTADDLPTWSPEIFGPIAKLDLDLEAVSELVTPEITREFLPEDLGVEKGNAPVPPFQVDEIGPINFELEEAIEEISIERTTATIKVVSKLPIALEPGARVELRNQEDEVIVEFDFNERLRANDSISKSIDIRDVDISSRIRFFVYDLSSNGSLQPVEINENTNIAVTLSFEDLTISEILFRDDQEIIIDEQFQFNGSENITSNAVEVEGEFKLLVKNGFPLTIPIALQVYDDNSNLLFELFNDEIERPNTGSNGRVNGPAEESEILIPVNENQLELLQEAAVIRFLARVQSGGNNNGYVLEKGRSLFIKLISNIALTID